MKARITSAKLKTILLFTWLTILAGAPFALGQGDVAVVVNSGNPVVNVSVADLRKIFAGEKRSWPGGLAIRLIVRAPGCHERLVLLKLLALTEGDYKKYWTSQMFRGEALEEPVEVFSNGMQKEGVAAIRGAIALMDSRDVKPGIKIVKLGGRLPGDGGYPLQ